MLNKPTIEDVAKAANVSIMTISRILNSKRAEKWDSKKRQAEQIRKIAKKLDYRPNSAARAMRTQSTGLIGVVIEEGGLRTHPVFSEVLQGADQVLKKAGYILAVTSLTGIEENTLETRIFREHLLDGLMVFDSSNENSVKGMLRAIPNCVMVNCDTWLPTCCVRRNEYAAGRLAGDELKSLGYKKAFYVNPETCLSEHYSRAERLSGFRDGFAAGNTDLSVHRIGMKQSLGWLEENSSLLDRNSVIVACNNLCLYRLMSAFTRSKLNVDEDFGLASLDDETGLLASFPEVSRISFPRVEIGGIAGRMMVDILAGNRANCGSVKVEGEWIAGTTTRKIS